MSLANYLAAVKSGKKEVQSCTALGLPTELPALDAILEHVDVRGESPLGLIDIPSDLIVGTKTRGRMTSFAPNFMPILEETSEFAMKWAHLCDAHLNEGIRDPIIAYEYLNHYYVLEGNKRVSVLKFFDATSIPGYVTRIIPEWKDTPEIRLYYEFLDFYNATNINYISFSKEGSYIRLNNFTGHKKHDRWNMDERIDFRSAYNSFSEAFLELGGAKLSCTIADAMLTYLDYFNYQQFVEETSLDIKVNLKKIWEEIELKQTDAAPEEKVAVKLDPTPDHEKSTLSKTLDVLTKPVKAVTKPVATVTKTSAKTITKIAFIHKHTAESSRWTYAHELGRTYLNDAFHGKILTTAYENVTTETVTATITQAIADGNTIIFTTTPEFLEASRKVAIEHPTIKILNCSLNTSHKYIRTYYARMFEAKLLNGVLAGVLTDTDKIGYIADYPILGMTANINAFALGVKMVNPRAKVYLEWTTLKENQGVDLTQKLVDMGATYISHLDMIVPQAATRFYGLYHATENGPVNLAFPVWDWGKFYERIIHNIQNGTWHSESKSDSGKALSYWWGMSSGVIDVMYSPAIPPSTKLLLETLKKSIMNYEFYPFDGILYSQDGIAESDPNHHMTVNEIIAMDWLSDNVVGFIPTAKDLVQNSQPVVRQEGILKEDEEG